MAVSEGGLDAVDDDVVERGYRVRGRVQGVGFRWWARGVALDFGLEGTVRNLVDGSVEVMARGDAASLRGLEVRLAEGPTFARVDSVETIAYTLPVHHSGFAIDQ
jgi:acylphosphatase